MKLRFAFAAVLFLLPVQGAASGSSAVFPAAVPGPALDAAPSAPRADATEADVPVWAMEAWIEPGEDRRPDMLHVAVLVHPDWWVHSLRQRGGGTEAKRTRIVVAADSPRQVAADFEPVAPPTGMTWDDFPELKGVVIEQHRGFVVWKAPLAAGGPMEVRGAITVQADSDFACAMPETHAFVARDPAARPGVAVRAINDLGIGIYRRLRAADSAADNLVISPVSLVAALSLLGAGAGGETAGEFGRVLHAGTGDAAYGREFGSLLAALAPPADGDGAAGGLPRERPELTIATRLWASGRFAILDGFARAARDDYRAGVAAFDETIPQAASDAVNAWVDEATAGRIPKMVDAATIEGAGVLLVNAVSMRAGWAKRFLPDRTVTTGFHVTPQDTVEVPMMEQRDVLRHARIRESGFDLGILELPYTGSFRMLILLPQGGTTLEAVEDRLSPAVWHAWSAGLHKGNVTAALPRFRIETQGVDMIPVLRDLGFASIADDDKADFSRLAARRIAVDLIRHSAMIAVDEKGTEAAAASDSGLREVSAIEATPVEFRADRPFLFVIDDPSTGAILFLGRLARP